MLYRQYMLYKPSFTKINLPIGKKRGPSRTIFYPQEGKIYFLKKMFWPGWKLSPRVSRHQLTSYECDVITIPKYIKSDRNCSLSSGWFYSQQRRQRLNRWPAFPQRRRIWSSLSQKHIPVGYTAYTHSSPYTRWFDLLGDHASECRLLPSQGPSSTQMALLY